MTRNILLIIFSVILNACGGGGSGGAPAGLVETELVTNSAAVEVDARSPTTGSVLFEASNFYSFAVDAGTSYTVTLRSLNNDDADLALYDDQLLSDQSLVGTSLLSASTDSISYDATDSRVMYIEIGTFDPSADYELYVNEQATLSGRLKIFVTEETYTGDFLNNPALAGSSVIEKADDACNNSTNKPDDALYKAFLTDGVMRDALTLTDWVMEPNMLYYRRDGAVVIGTTNFDSMPADITLNSVDDCPECAANSLDVYFWSGKTSTVSRINLNCSGWSTNTLDSGQVGNYTINSFLDSQGVNCALELRLVCVQQR